MTAVVALAAFALCWVALGVVAIGLHRWLAPALGALHAAARAGLLLALALLPLVVASLVAVLSFAPAIGGWIVDEHCHPTTGCAAHVPVVHADALYAAGFAFVATAGVVALLWSVARRLRNSLRVASSLRSFAEPHERRRFETIESREQFAYCIGLLRPKIVISRGLIERLSSPQLEVVLRHEQAHASRRDNLRLWLAGLALLPMPVRSKRRLLAELALAGEQTCDDAASSVGGPELVVETLGALSGATLPSRRRALATFGGAATLATRVAALRGRRLRPVPVWVEYALVLIAYTAIAIVTTDTVHHGTELLLATFS